MSLMIAFTGLSGVAAPGFAPHTPAAGEVAARCDRYSGKCTGNLEKVSRGAEVPPTPPAEGISNLERIRFGEEIKWARRPVAGGRRFRWAVHPRRRRPVRGPARRGWVP